MDLHDALLTGDFGVQLRLPRAEVQASDPDCVKYLDPAQGVFLEVRKLLWPAEFSPENEAPHFRDCTRQAQAIFDAHKTPHPLDQWRVPAEQPEPEGPVDAAANTPIVELGIREHHGTQIHRSIHRITLAPGDELVQGQVIVPLPDGCLEIKLFAKAAETGVRECILMLKLGGRPTRAQYDDPSWDATFPQHPLSRIRAYLRELLEDEQLSLSLPPSTPLGPELVLPRSRATIRPPARFGLVDPARFPSAGRQDVLTRIALLPSHGPTFLDVLRLVSSPPPADPRSLEALAQANAAAWGADRFTNLETELGDATRGPHGLSLAARLSFWDRTGAPRVSLKRWRVSGGQVLRFALTLPSWQHEHETQAAAELDRVAESWRPLP